MNDSSSLPVAVILAGAAGPAAADTVPLQLPPTGACCGGPAKSPTDSCCARDEAAKDAGEAGCGCAKAPPGRSRPVTAASCC
jgi:hypothetical protein